MNTERFADTDLTLDLNKIVAAKRAAGVKRSAAAANDCYAPSYGWAGGEYPTPEMAARDEQAIRNQRDDSRDGLLGAGVTW